MRFQEKVCAVLTVALLTLGCGAAEDPQPAPDPSPRATAPESASQHIPVSAGFSWIVPGTLAAMPRPGRNRPLDQDAAFLEQEGIGVLVSLTEEPPDVSVLGSHSIESRHIPIEDYTPPTADQMTEFVDLVESSSGSGTPVGVHCAAGLGRSGTMAAAYLVATGSSAEDAIAAIRTLRPGSIETPEQEEAVRRFAQTRDDDR